MPNPDGMPTDRHLELLSMRGQEEVKMGVIMDNLQLALEDGADLSGDVRKLLGSRATIEEFQAKIREEEENPSE